MTVNCEKQLGNLHNPSAVVIKKESTVRYVQRIYNFYRFKHEKSLMFKYGRMQRKIPSQLVRGFHSVSLECMLLGVQVTTELGLFLHSHCLEDSNFLL